MHTTKNSMDCVRVTFNLDYDLPPAKAHISRVHEVFLKSGMRFSLPDVILEILNEYRIAPSQLVPNSWRILVAFFLGCKSMAVDPYSRVFKLFYTLKMNEGWYFF